jgi:hypothetical protein
MALLNRIRVEVNGAADKYTIHEMHAHGKLWVTLSRSPLSTIASIDAKNTTDWVLLIAKVVRLTY